VGVLLSPTRFLDVSEVNKLNTQTIAPYRLMSAMDSAFADDLADEAIQGSETMICPGID